MVNSKAKTQPTGLDEISILLKKLFLNIFIPVVKSESGNAVIKLKDLFANKERQCPIKDPPNLLPPFLYLVPLISIDRLFGGESTFRLGKWIKEYLKCYFWGLKQIYKKNDK